MGVGLLRIIGFNVGLLFLFMVSKQPINRQFFTSASLLLAVNLLIKPIYILGIDRSVQNYVGAENYGVYFAIFNFSLLGQVLLDFGINNFTNKNIAQQPHLLPHYLAVFVRFKLLLSVAYGVLCVAAAYLMGYDKQQQYLLCWLALSQVLASVVLFLRAGLQGLQAFSADRWVSVTDRLWLIVVVGACLWYGGGLRIEAFAALQAAAYSVSLGVALGFMWYHLPQPSVAAQLPDLPAPPSWNVLLRQTLPYALLGVLMLVYSRIDAVLLVQCLPRAVGKQQAGLYANAFRLFDAANMIAVLFSTILLPMFARLLLNAHSQLVGLVDYSMRLMLVATIVMVVPACFWSDVLMQQLYANQQAHLLLIFNYLMIALVATVSVYIYGTLLTAKGSIRQLNLIAAVGVLLNISLNAYLIPRQQAVGAALASSITQTVVALLHIAVAIRVCALPFEAAKVLKISLFVLLSVLSCWAIRQYSANTYPYIAAPLALGVCVGWAWLTRTISLSDLHFLHKKT